MYKGFYGWSLESNGSGTVETKYIVEYVNDSNTWDRICYINEHYSEIEPRQESYELYSKKEFDNVSDALSFYMVWFIDDSCYDIKMYEQIFVNDNMVLEQMIEPKSTIMHCMRDTVNRDMNKRMADAEKEVNSLQKSIKMYQDFIERCNAKKTFEEFIKNYIEEGK